MNQSSKIARGDINTKLFVNNSQKNKQLSFLKGSRSTSAAVSHVLWLLLSISMLIALCGVIIDLNTFLLHEHKRVDLGRNESVTNKRKISHEKTYDHPRRMSSIRNICLDNHSIIHIRRCLKRHKSKFFDRFRCARTPFLFFPTTAIFNARGRFKQEVSAALLANQTVVTRHLGRISKHIQFGKSIAKRLLLTHNFGYLFEILQKKFSLYFSGGCRGDISIRSSLLVTQKRVVYLGNSGKIAEKRKKQYLKHLPNKKAVQRR